MLCIAVAVMISRNRQLAPYSLLTTSERVLDGVPCTSTTDTSVPMSLPSTSSRDSCNRFPAKGTTVGRTLYGSYAGVILRTGVGAGGELEPLYASTVGASLPPVESAAKSDDSSVAGASPSGFLPPRSLRSPRRFPLPRGLSLSERSPRGGAGSSRGCALRVSISFSARAIFCARERRY